MEPVADKPTASGGLAVGRARGGPRERRNLSSGSAPFKCAAQPLARGALAVVERRFPEGWRRLRLPLVEGVRLSFFVVSAIREAHERETVPFVEAASVHVLPKDPQP